MKSISMLSVGSFVATPTGLIVNGSPSFDEWLAYGKHLQVINQSLQMLIGDWLNEGEKRYGETYAQATVLFPEAQLQTLKNWKWVASRVPKSLRSDDLHYSHYNAVAGVESMDERKRLLGVAITSGWSSNELKAKVNPKPAPAAPSLRDVLLAIDSAIDDAGAYPDKGWDVTSHIGDASESIRLALKKLDASKSATPAHPVAEAGTDA